MSPGLPAGYATLAACVAQVFLRPVLMTRQGIAQHELLLFAKYTEEYFALTVRAISV
jgi:hypothetical protein